MQSDIAQQLDEFISRGDRVQPFGLNSGRKKIGTGLNPSVGGRAWRQLESIESCPDVSESIDEASPSPFCI
jgi:hypothetical protein